MPREKKDVPEINPEELLSFTEAMQELNFKSRTSLDRLIKDKKIGYVKVGRYTKFTPDQIKAYKERKQKIIIVDPED